jgi:hypothetical protein
LNLKSFTDFLTDAQAIETEAIILKNTLIAMQVLETIPTMMHDEQEQADASGRIIEYQDANLAKASRLRFFGEVNIKGLISGKRPPVDLVISQLNAGRPHGRLYMDSEANQTYARLSTEV